MNPENSLAKDIEELVNKSIEANKVFMTEGSRILRQFTAPGEKKTPDIFQPNFLSDAFTSYARLNIQHLKNMVDLGVSILKNAGPQTAGSNEETTETPGPSFVLEAEGEAGSKVSLSFLLDNSKPESVLCNLVNSSYLFNANTVEENFETRFTPQSFTMSPGEQQRIHINIAIPNATSPGIYVSNVTVRGFEPAYFSIRLLVNEKPTKTAPNGRKKAGSK